MYTLNDMNIQTIIFDLGGVLLDIDLNHCIRQMQALGVDLDALNQKGLQTPSGTQAAVLGEGIVANGAMHLYQVGDITTQQFLEGVCQFCRPGTTPQQVLQAWNTCCIGIPRYRLEKLAELKSRGYRICMLSNTNEAHWQKIVAECFGGQEVVDRHFDHVFLSQEVHMAKPNDDIYLHVLRTLGTQAENCLFIDDSTPNVQAALQLGLHAIKADISQTCHGHVVAPPLRDWTREIDGVLKEIG